MSLEKKTADKPELTDSVSIENQTGPAINIEKEPKKHYTIEAKDTPTIKP